MPILTRLRSTCFLFLVFCAGTSVAAQALPASVRAALQQAGIPAGAVATYVQEIGSKKTLIASNANDSFNPASTMKLLTTDAALELLGPTYTWKTQAYSVAPQVGDVLQGNLIIKGNGDPKLVLENFWLFLRQLRARGIREIRGNLVLDRSAFELETFDAEKFDGDPLKPYNAGPDALLLNYNAVGFRFIPDEANGVINVSVDPPLAGYTIHAPKLGSGSCDDWQNKLQASVGADNTKFDGSFAASCGEKIWFLHPTQLSQSQYFAAVFRQLWRDMGGSFKGEVVSGITPADARLLAEWQSPSLPEVIRDINKFSNNVMARQLLLTLAIDSSKRPATPQRGALAVKAWLASKNIDAPELVIENGSGLSRIERVSASTMGRMLVAAFRSPTMSEFISSMPLVGYDGTMRRRLTTSAVAGNAHIKTGSLNDVRALAGYVTSASGKNYAVVSMINHANASRGQEAQDALLQWVYEQR
ncbi:MAG: D-alanyl-D-alanine carboxypeptidase/D-alanyl-D-alanine-endopeptidase [Pseudomonadota bacterium]